MSIMVDFTILIFGGSKWARAASLLLGIEAKYLVLGCETKGESKLIYKFLGFMQLLTLMIPFFSRILSRKSEPSKAALGGVECQICAINGVRAIRSCGHTMCWDCALEQKCAVCRAEGDIRDVFVLH